MWHWPRNIEYFTISRMASFIIGHLHIELFERQLSELLDSDAVKDGAMIDSVMRDISNCMEV